MRVLLVNSIERQCGVFQYGQALFECIRRSEKHTVMLAKVDNRGSLAAFINTYPQDVIVYNFHPSTMPWIWEVPKNLAWKQIIIKHECYHMYPLWIDAVVSQDPNPNPWEKTEFNLGRPILDYQRPEAKEWTFPTIGSFGFGTAGKGFIRLIKQVQAEFKSARIRLLIPFAKYGDADGALAQKTAAECYVTLDDKHFTLEIRHDFIDDQRELLNWLSQNTLNAFLYDENRSTGISQCPDWAIMARRPVALTRCQMFRSYFDIDGIFVDKRSLKEIIDAGIAPLKPVYERWSPQKISEQFDNIVDRVCAK